MKKIINNRLYDTSTARLVGSYDVDLTDNMAYIEESLYCKRNMEYFLHGEGGLKTRYARSAGPNTWTWGEKIIPLSYDAAKEWAQEHMDADAYMKEFGPVSEDGSRVSICISLPGPAAEKAKRLAAVRGVTVSALIAGLIEKESE